MLNEQGYHRPTYEEILESKIQKAKDLFGEDIDTSEITPLGKFIRIGAYDLSKAYEDLEAVYYARFPNTASGTSLDRLCVFAGISRNPPTAAQHKIKVYGEVGTTLGIGELIVCGEDTEITFYNVNNYTISENGYVTDEDGNTTTAVVECTEAGEKGNVTTLTEIVNPIAEIDHIEYVGIDEIGEGVESDYELRNRFSVAIAGAGSANTNAIRAALLRVTNVVSAGVIVNDTDETVDGRPPHSFECFVHGGEGYEKEIAEAIFEKKPIGIQTCTTGKNTVEITLKDDGGYDHIIKFSRTEDVPVYIKIAFVKNSSFEADGEAQISKIITEYINGLGVGTDVILSTLYGRIYSVNGIVDVTSITMSTNGTTYKAENIVIGDYQVAKISNIEFEVTE